jgi:predicted GTPase
VVLVGVTGVGKSTLGNVVLGMEMSPVGDGFSVTQEIHRYRRQGCPFSVYDTPGLELSPKGIGKQIDDIVTFVKNSQREDHRLKIHLVWLCILEDDARVDNAYRTIYERIRALGVPVLPVITKSMKKNQEDPRGRVADRLGIDASHADKLISTVLAKAQPYGDGDPPETKEPHGLERLVQRSYEAIAAAGDPELAKIFGLSQRVDDDLRETLTTENRFTFMDKAGIIGGSLVPVVAFCFCGNYQNTAQIINRILSSPKNLLS